jgi:hypothetical protein
MVGLGSDLRGKHCGDGHPQPFPLLGGFQGKRRGRVGLVTAPGLYVIRMMGARDERMKAR